MATEAPDAYTDITYGDNKCTYEHRAELLCAMPVMYGCAFGYVMCACVCN